MDCNKTKMTDMWAIEQGFSKRFKKGVDLKIHVCIIRHLAETRSEKQGSSRVFQSAIRNDSAAHFQGKKRFEKLFKKLLTETLNSVECASASGDNESPKQTFFNNLQ